MLDLQNLTIKRIDNSNVSQRFIVHLRNNTNHEYKFTIRIGCTIDDIVHIEVEKSVYFLTLYKIIRQLLNLLDIQRDDHKIRYNFSQYSDISIDLKSKILKIYCLGKEVADVYLNDNCINLYETSYNKYGKTDIFCSINDNDLYVLKGSDLSYANKLLGENKSLILTAINYFNFLAKR